MEAQIRAAGLRPDVVSYYGDVDQERRKAAFKAQPLVAVRGASAAKKQRSKRLIAVDTTRDVVPDTLKVKWVHESQDRTVYESVVLMAACN